LSFVRTDVQPALELDAHVANVVGTELCTRLGVAGRADGASVSTVEHLLAALAGLGVRGCRIELDGPELPILDGSALPWVEAIAEASAGLEGMEAGVDSERGSGRATVSCRSLSGRILASGTSSSAQEGDDASAEGGSPRAHRDHGDDDVLDSSKRPLSVRPLMIAAPVECTGRGGATIAAMPADRLRFSYSIEFEDAAIGAQAFEWTPPADAEAAAAEFARELAPARTFTTSVAARALQASGRKHGGSLLNALVTDGAGGWANRSPLRFANEPVRHKMLDLIGDLALCGRPLGPMHIIAHRAGHGLHVALVRALLRADADARDR
jgi:UDP-3-O-[3-hydroxymyristoyl] N-acetylglucosamine deacetylase